jgi:DNA-binding response OmpR family regulator
MKKILIVDDDAAIVKGVQEALREEHFDVLVAETGGKGTTMARRENIDLILLDLRLPDKNGEDICRELRADGITTPIIMLTSKKEEMEKVLGLELGADDYLTKPFGIHELVARVRAVLRRNREMKKEVEEYAFDDVSLDFKKQEARKKGKPLKLTAREFNTLKYFVAREGEVVTRAMLLDEVWGYENFPTTRTIDNYILSLRKKIESDPSRPRHLITVHTAGYKFVK